MKTLFRKKRNNSGYAIMLVLIMTGIALFILGSTMNWCISDMKLTGRNNEYFRTLAAAEAATEKVLANMQNDYQVYGDARVFSRLDAYKNLYPTSGENAYWGKYKFTNGTNANKTHVALTAAQTYKVLTAQYKDLRGYSTLYRISSNAQEKNSQFKITTALRQDIQLATIPLFQFAIFYNLNLEIMPGPDMMISGPVHGNETVYINPGASLVFSNDVTSHETIVNAIIPGDPDHPKIETDITYLGLHESGRSSLNLPIGTNNTPAAVREVIERPLSGESTNSAISQQRLYNKADMIITLRSDGTLLVTSGKVNNFATTVTNAGYFINTNASFYNAREGKTVKPIDIDVGKLKTWSANSSSNKLWSLLPFNHQVRMIYVVDDRPGSVSSSKEPGVRLVNGASLPTEGLTVVSPNPIYIQGDYNTTGWEAAAIIGDAITVLSTDWDDADSTKSLSNRKADDTTVNAAFLGGIVETTASGYSGGVENFPRFLEDWKNETFTYNGSMVVMFPSKFATALWDGTGGYYNPPDRNWSFDTKFMNPTNLPPFTPSARSIIRTAWDAIKPGTT